MQYDDLEFINCQNVLNCIEDKPEGISRASVAKQVGLSRTAISLIVQRLMNLGFVSEHATEIDGTRGRPGTPLTLNPNIWHSIGANYQSGKWYFVAVDCFLNVKQSKVLSVPDFKEETLLAVLLEGLEEMRASCPGKMIPAFGIGSPGLVDNEKGLICRCDDLGWDRPFGICKKVKEKTGLGSYLINRYCANGNFEVKTHKYQKMFPGIVYLGMGTGMGSATFQNGQLLLNMKNRLGHVSVDPNGQRCQCGQYGCIQTMVCESSWIRIAKELGMRDACGEITSDFIANEAKMGNPIAKKTIDKVADNLGALIGIIVNTISPNLVILGGPIGNNSKYLLEKVQKNANSRLLDWQSQQLTIIKGEPNIWGAAIGAAMFPLQHRLELVQPKN